MEEPVLKTTNEPSDKTLLEKTTLKTPLCAIVRLLWDPLDHSEETSVKSLLLVMLNLASTKLTAPT
jgi:hypothetical protein